MQSTAQASFSKLPLCPRCYADPWRSIAVLEVCPIEEIVRFEIKAHRGKLGQRTPVTDGGLSPRWSRKTKCAARHGVEITGRTRITEVRSEPRGEPLRGECRVLMAWRLIGLPDARD